MLLPIVLKPHEANKAFIDRIDVEVVSAFANLITKLYQTQAEPVVLNPRFPELMSLFTQICINVNEQELTTKVVTLFQAIVERLANQKLQGPARM